MKIKNIAMTNVNFTLFYKKYKKVLAKKKSANTIET